MFWAFMLIAALAVVFVKLGAYSVWMTILSTGLTVAILVIACLATALIWREVSSRRDRN